MCEDFAPSFGDKRIGCCNTLSHTSFFITEFFLPKTTRLSSSTHPTFLFPRLKIKLKGRHFDTVEVIEAELRAMLSTLTEHDFQKRLKKMAEALGTVQTRGRGKGNTSKMMVASRPKVTF
jgi:hypothetical protein